VSGRLGPFIIFEDKAIEADRTPRAGTKVEQRCQGPFDGEGFSSISNGPDTFVFLRETHRGPSNRDRTGEARMNAIRTRPLTYYTGFTADGRQVLLGWLSNSIVIVFFDAGGTLLKMEEHALDLRKSFGPAIEAEVDKKIQAIRERLGIREGPIHVQPFFIENVCAGIKPYPADLQDYLSNPGSYSEEDAQIFRADVERWRAAGNCVLRWGEDYHIDSDGCNF
jgi:hypothetical protein